MVMVIAYDSQKLKTTQMPIDKWTSNKLEYILQ